MKFKETEIGIIPEDWKVRRLTDLLSITVDNRGKSAPTSENGIPLIATNCIKEDGLYPVKEKIRYVSEETYNNWFRDHPKPDDIIIVNKGTPGQVCLVPDPVDFCIAQDMIAIRPDTERINGRYLFAYMRSKFFKHQVDTLNVGTTIPHLKKTIFSKLLIPIPKNEEQIEIGNIYYNISKKIELNRQMNSTLEQIAQTLFKHWFIDFEFPDENGNPYRSSGGRMVDSELGEIPEGWKNKRLEDIAVINESSVKKDYPYDEIIYVDISSVDNGKLIETTKYEIKKAPSRAKRIVKNGDIIWSMVRPNRRSYLLILDPQRNLILSTGFAVISPKVVPYSYLYFWVTTDSFVNYLSLSADGSAYPAVTADRFKEARILVPEQEILNEFEKFTTSLLIKMNCNSIESLKLAKIRDSLLPKIMSGKIRVQV